MNEEPVTGGPSMHSDDHDGIATHLGRLAVAGDSSERVAHEVAATLFGMDQALAPIVGHRGVAALYKRALHLAKPSFHWLPDASTGPASAIDLAPLTAALAGQNAAEAALAGARLLRDFRALLTSLIGPSLTERLLRSVWAPFLSPSPAQDNTP